MNDVEPQVWRADVLRRIAGHTAKRLGEQPPWNREEPDATPVDQAG